jgi:hypothetical protein
VTVFCAQGVKETGNKDDDAERGDMNEAAIFPQQRQEEEEEDELSYSSVDEDEFEMDAGGQTEMGNMNSALPCPTFKFSGTLCDWYGTLRNLKNHVICSHKGILRRDNVFHCRTLQKAMAVILYHGEIFLYYKHVSYTGIIYAVVQQVGTTNKKFKYTIVLSAEDSVDNMNLSFAVTNIVVPLEIIFDAGTCMAMTEDRLEPFVKHRQLEMVVRLKEVRTRRNTTDRPSSTRP